MNTVYQLQRFSGVRQQRLRQVRVHCASIVWVQQGEKRLHLSQTTRRIDPSALLLIAPKSQLTFDNLPHHTKFESLQISLYLPPSEANLALNKENKHKQSDQYLPLNAEMATILSTLVQAQKLSKPVASALVQTLYTALAMQGVLHLLFPKIGQSMTERLSQFLSQDPGFEHNIQASAEHFAISKATLIRRLKEEDTQYRQVLAQVRMSHALSLMQAGTPVEHLASQCGYQSNTRFKQRFKAMYDLGIDDYLATLG